MTNVTNAARPLPEEAHSRYAIDAKESAFVVQAFATGLLAAFGHSPRIAIRDFQGEVSFREEGESIVDATLEMKIRASSLEVIDDVSEKDRNEIQREMYDSVLEVDRFAEIAYRSRQISVNGVNHASAVINGDLTLHGITRPLTIAGSVVFNGDFLRASGQFAIRLSEYGIAPVKAAAGTIKLKDELKFTFDVVAHRQE